MSQLHDHKTGKVKEQKRIEKEKEEIKKNKALYEKMFGKSE